MRLSEDFAGILRDFANGRRADFDAFFLGGFGRFEFFLRFDRGGGTFNRRLLR